MTRTPRFALVDHSLTSALGHNLIYARRVLAAAASEGFETLAGVGRRGADQDIGAPSFARFSQDVWRNNPAEGRLWHAAALLRRAPVTRPQRAAGATAALPVPQAGGPGAQSNRLERLARALLSDVEAIVEERRSVRRFAQELGGFLADADLQAGDVVYMPTVLAAELRALDGLLARSEPARRLRWRLMLRYAPKARSVRAALARAAGRLNRRRDADVRFFSDTERLCAGYERLCKTPFRLLPVPVDAPPLLKEKPTGVFVVGYLGDSRDEKGFDLLPEVIAEVRRKRPDRSVRFLIQLNLNTLEGDPGARTAMDALITSQGEDVELVQGPLSPEDYTALLRRTDIVLLPYRPHAYAERSSGILMEAITAGLPTVVTRGAWLEATIENASSLTPAGVVAHPEADALADAVIEIADDWSRYAAGARHLRDALRFRFNPAELVREVAKTADRE